MEVSVEVHKINTFFIYEMRCWWSCRQSNKLSTMPIRCAIHSVSNIHRHFENREWVCPICPELYPICIHTHLTHKWWQKHKWKSWQETKRSKELLCLDQYFLNRRGYFIQSSLDCFSTGVWAFMQYIYFFIFNILFILGSICYNF